MDEWMDRGMGEWMNGGGRERWVNGWMDAGMGE